MISIAIDGPSGAGKSSLSRCVAERLGFTYVDTGALYRAVALHFLDGGEKRLDNLKLDILWTPEGQRVLSGGRDVTEELRRHSLSALASDCSALPEVRAFLLERQRSLAEEQNVIMDGRDIGTVVLPRADVKIFLTASAEDRAARRTAELREKGQQVEFSVVLEDMRLRDEKDANRPIAPLRPADDAIILRTDGNSFEESVALLEQTIRRQLGGQYVL